MGRHSFGMSMSSPAVKTRHLYTLKSLHELNLRCTVQLNVVCHIDSTSHKGPIQHGICVNPALRCMQHPKAVNGMRFCELSLRFNVDSTFVPSGVTATKVTGVNLQVDLCRNFVPVWRE